MFERRKKYSEFQRVCCRMIQHKRSALCINLFRKKLTGIGVLGCSLFINNVHNRVPTDSGDCYELKLELRNNRNNSRLRLKTVKIFGENVFLMLVRTQVMHAETVVIQAKIRIWSYSIDPKVEENIWRFGIHSSEGHL